MITGPRTPHGLVEDYQEALAEAYPGKQVRRRYLGYKWVITVEDVKCDDAAFDIALTNEPDGIIVTDIYSILNNLKIELEEA